MSTKRGADEGSIGQAASEGRPELTIVMPFYNPGLELSANVADVVAALDRTGMRFEVLAVNDGSTDASAATSNRCATSGCGASTSRTG